jgi:dipeptidyl aminopeptidase/acylaminoacyl peptidase
MKIAFVVPLSLLLAAAPALGESAARTLTLDDLASLQELDEPRLSPDGEWIAYSVKTSDLKRDRKTTDLWLVGWRGSTPRQLTSTPESESAPQWSPDGRWLGFLSSRRNDDENDQLWRLPIDGGEAEPLTQLPGSVDDYAISPDGRQVVLVVSDPQDKQPLVKDTQTKKPIVIDRFYFKEDYSGYLGAGRQHLVLLDVATRATRVLTSGSFSETLPSWSPDGRQIAFVSKRSADPDRDDQFGIYLMSLESGAQPRLLVKYQGSGAETDWAPPPQWSPDGAQLAYVAGGDPKLLYYAQYSLAVVDVATGKSRELTRTLDRNVEQPRWSRDGRSLFGMLEDDGTMQIVQVFVADGQIRRITHGLHHLASLDRAANDRLVVLRSDPQHPHEIYSVEKGRFRALSNHNGPWLSAIRLATFERTEAFSPDGTRSTGFLVRPLDDQPGRRYPTVLRIHGGPVSQYNFEFMFDWQLLAAQGYAVVASNPRGSSGRGEAYSRAIFADWGNVDAQDVLAHVDLAVKRGIADPDRLGVGGWSYGGMLTNYVIARTTRFKAAVSGASISNILAGYGTDMYVREYEMELGTPWENPAGWMKVSFPFLHADRITTPTLFLCGADDFNVPLLNSEQMYQALRSRNIPTQLVIYPDQFHGLDKPSYLRDRLQRYLDWYGRYLKP